ncbi:MAG: hypothetical protein LBJ42_01625, partial [Holosporales bacterium]|nr:hypothetical protein [Holosporales bacterium]
MGNGALKFVRIALLETTDARSFARKVKRHLFSCIIAVITIVTNQCMAASAREGMRRIIIVGAAGKQGQEHFDTLNDNGYRVIAVVDSHVAGLQRYGPDVLKYACLSDLKSSF